ncbi:MAG: hypothetical protein HKN53_00330 [Maribacter sp.]|nr:hypothetical protein [Maribacter sp.]
MESIIKHRVIQNDTTAFELLEKRDSNNKTLWYRAEIETEVCREKLCELAFINIYWDEVGDYLKFTLPEERDLTKNDHTPFDVSDYQKLDEILADPENELKYYSFHEINDAVENLRKEYEDVDGITGATPIGMVDAVVNGAALSSYTFWHLVYGAARDTIKQHVRKKTNQEYISQKLKSNRSNFRIWAIEEAKELFQTEDAITHEIMQLVSDDPNKKVSNEALNFFTDALLEKRDIQKKLMHQFYKASHEMKIDILNRQKKLRVIYPETFDFLLAEFAEKRIGVLAFSSIMEIAQSVKKPSESSFKIIRELLLHDNYYVARKAYDFVVEHPSNIKGLKKNMKIFERKYADRLD